jgi:hypothetical protein
MGLLGIAWAFFDIGQNDDAAGLNHAEGLATCRCELPCLRHSSVTTAPASASFRMPMICSSENCFRFIRPSLRSGRTLAPTGGKSGGHVTQVEATADLIACYLPNRKVTVPPYIAGSRFWLARKVSGGLKNRALVFGRKLVTLRPQAASSSAPSMMVTAPRRFS